MTDMFADLAKKVNACRVDDGDDEDDNPDIG